MRLDQLVGDHRAQVVVAQRRDLPFLVRRPEPVEEMQERHARLERRGVRDAGEVVCLLHRARTQHRESDLPARHHVRVVAEDGEGVGRERACRDVHAERRQLTGDLVHVGDHQEQALRRREGGREGAPLQRAVHRAGGAALGLHLAHVRDDAPHVAATLDRPFVGQLAHRR
jgi:hypothetical protein